MTSQLNWQAPAINRKKVGDMTVTMLSDGYLDVSFELLSGCKRTRFSSTHFLRFPGFQPSAGILPASGYSGIRGGARRYIQPASAL